ncbi:MAG: hypothetical protein MZV64_49345 [Ignavibacteriales bacterium]|nr:hypothetical protein [Ignavibacteriales bacterium]
MSSVNRPSAAGLHPDRGPRRRRHHGHLPGRVLPEHPQRHGRAEPRQRDPPDPDLPPA